MWPSAGCSEAGSGRRAAALLAGVALACTAPAAARVLLTVDEALALAFPGCAVERGTVYLTAGQLASATELAGEPLAGAIVHPYQARCGGAPGGTAYFDTHRVRTLPETVMVVVDPRGVVRRVEVLAFDEPPDYLPRAAWYGQFLERELGPETDLGRAIRPVTGATLTARATTAAVRRVLALHRVLRPPAQASAAGPP